MFKVLLITFFTLHTFALDIVKVGPKGKSSIIYIRDNYVYLRHCPKYKIVNKRSDCQNNKEIKLIPVTGLKHLMRKVVPPFLDQKWIDDQEILSKADKYYYPLSMKRKKKLKEKKEAIENYREKFGPSAINTTEYNEIIVRLKKDENAKEVNKLIEKEINLAIKRIGDNETIFQQKQSEKSLNNVLIRHLISLGSKTHSQLELEPIDSKCSLVLKERENYESKFSSRSYFLYKNGKRIGSSWDICHIYFYYHFYDDERNNSKENSCKNWIKKKAPSCHEGFLKKPNLSVDVDNTSDEAISDNQRSILIKGTTSTLKKSISPSAKKK